MNLWKCSETTSYFFLIHAVHSPVLSFYPPAGLHHSIGALSSFESMDIRSVIRDNHPKTKRHEKSTLPYLVGCNYIIRLEQYSNRAIDKLIIMH